MGNASIYRTLIKNIGKICISREKILSLQKWVNYIKNCSIAVKITAFLQ